MKDAFLGLKTDQVLLDKLLSDARKPSHSELLEQRVSYVFGSMKPSIGVTRERVRQVILEQDGGSAGAVR